MKRLFYCDIHYACFGFEATNNIITLCPPMIKWMMGKSLSEVKRWFLNKKATIKEII
jgi:hypothetical protein